MADIPDDARTRIEAAAFRRLLEHFGHRTDVQNVDLMSYSGFCRNCLADWYRAAATEEGVELSKDEAREAIYGMPYGDWKEKYQTPASDEQLARMDESTKKNAGRGF